MCMRMYVCTCTYTHARAESATHGAPNTALHTAQVFTLLFGLFMILFCDEPPFEPGH